MAATDAIAIHIDAEFQIAFTVVVAVAACVAGWRYLRAALRRRSEEQAGKPPEEGGP